MRRFIPISLVALILLNVFGFYISFLLKKDCIRTEMAELIKGESDENLQAITFSKTDFDKIDWTIKGKEFRKNGKLNDVAKIEVLANTIKVYVLEDSQENDLVADFTSTVQQQSEKDQGNSPLKVLLQQFLNEFTPHQNVLSLYPPQQSLSTISQSTESCLLSFITELQSPPPQSV